MFRKYSKILNGDLVKYGDVLFKVHPSVLAYALECAWEMSRKNPNSTLEIGLPDYRSDLPGLPKALPGLPKSCETLYAALKGSLGNEEKVYVTKAITKEQVWWDHLIYAYMIENTRIYEIFERVVREFLHGELLGAPVKGSEHWLRNTEELFYKDPAPFFITSVASHLRPDLRATRRNAYYRMFGMDLNHGIDDKKEYPYMKAKASNMDFVSNFEDLLREVWVGIVNLKNTTGVNPTDDAAIANLAERLHNMMISRRETGNLSREEFYAVSTMSWFHLTLEYDSPIVVALRAEATSPEERLFKIAERVKLPAHGLSRSYFEMADPISMVLLEIEKGTGIKTSDANLFYNNSSGTNPLPDNMKTIITHWGNITGRNMKIGKTQVTA